jgi:hypothetical protein
MIFLLTFSYLNAMPPTPLVEWEEEEIADGAVSFADRIQRLLNHTKPVTTKQPFAEATTAISPTTTGYPFVEKIANAVVHVIPQLTDAVQRELQPSTSSFPAVTTFTTTTPVTPSPPCGPDHIQVSFVIGVPFFYSSCIYLFLLGVLYFGLIFRRFLLVWHS